MLKGQFTSAISSVKFDLRCDLNLKLVYQSVSMWPLINLQQNSLAYGKQAKIENSHFCYFTKSVSYRLNNQTYCGLVVMFMFFYKVVLIPGRLYVCVCVYIYVYICICIYMFENIYMFVCVCVREIALYNTSTLIQINRVTKT